MATVVEVIVLHRLAKAAQRASRDGETASKQLMGVLEIRFDSILNGPLGRRRMLDSAIRAGGGRGNSLVIRFFCLG